MKIFSALGIAAAMLGFIATSSADDGQVWDSFGGNPQAQKYSTATQITPANVAKLTPAWEMHTGDISAVAPKSVWGATPLFVNNTIYVSTPKYRLFALEPDTGKTKWVYDDHRKQFNPMGQYVKSRGAAYWQAASPAKGQPCQKTVYFGSLDGHLSAVDADSGKACKGFGDGGVINVNKWATTNSKWPVELYQPPSVYKDTLILGWAGVDWEFTTENPGTVFGIDARTGKLKWTFHIIPDDMVSVTGTANVWAGMSVDPTSGLVYVPVSAPSPNYYGAKRKKEMPYVNSVTALNAETGAVVWSRQLVHHDIWDYDINSPPTLLDLKKDGKIIPALVQATKQGFLFVLNRMTGEPIYPIQERPYPKSDIPGEVTAPTQPYVPLPEPTVPDHWPGVYSLADKLSLGYCSKVAQSFRDEGRYTPLSMKGTTAFPGTIGGIEWAGGAVDPTTGTYVVNSSDVVQIYHLYTREEYAARLKTMPKALAGAAQAGSPYAFHYDLFLNPFKMPCWNPPYGTLSSYDLTTGKLLWKKPFGQVQKWGFYMPESWGSPTIGGPVITKSGLVFIGASMDSRVRAVDLKTGNVLWKAQVDAPAVSTPASYTYKGRQYVVFVAGGNPIYSPQLSDQVIAYALPN